MKEIVKKHDKPAIEIDTVLNTSLSRTIMESTDRFEFIKGDDETMIFWDSYWEEEVSISPKWTLEKIMNFITNFYSEDFMWRGEQKAQREMRRALGLETSHNK